MQWKNIITEIFLLLSLKWSARDYSKAEKYKVNIWKSNTLIYISNEKLEFKIKNTIRFILVLKKMNCLVISISPKT